ncbi:hypothetical protein NC651_029755 [Populus alba x Populus x berolinensis]|nr:hypothetical protein NC651_029755 [Populus alba x Populus x berolinensis]
MKITLDEQDIIEQGSLSMKGKGVCSSGSETSNPWPYRIKLTTDSMRWDSLKISPSWEFNNHVLENMSEANRDALDMWKAIEVSIYDVDTQEIYKPFRQIIKKRGLRYDQEIGFRCSGNATVDTIEFSVDAGKATNHFEEL